MQNLKDILLAELYKGISGKPLSHRLLGATGSFSDNVDQNQIALNVQSDLESTLFDYGKNMFEIRFIPFFPFSYLVKSVLSSLTLYHTITTFNDPEKETFKKHYGKR